MLDTYHIYPVTRYHVSAHSTFSQTRQIQAVIDLASQNGGICFFPAGSYVTGTLRLRSNVTLQFASGARLLGSPDLDDYSDDTHYQRYAGESHMDRCLIYAENVNHICLKGPGQIDGQAEFFPFLDETGHFRSRPMLIRMLNCRNIHVADLAIKNPASWSTAFICCQSVRINGCQIETVNAGNGDGLDFDSCQDVIVSDCQIKTSDDCICLQNSEPSIACRNITITNCTLTSQWAGIRIGLLSQFLIEQVVISNCVIHDCGCSGFKIQLCEGGQIRDIAIQNIVMRNVPRPFMITANRWRCGVDAPDTIPETGGIDMIRISHILMRNDSDQLDQNSGILMMGIPGLPVSNVFFNHVSLSFNHDSRAVQDDLAGIPGLTGVRPEYTAFDGKLVSYAVYLRHVRNCSFDDLSVHMADRPLRSAIAVDDGQNIHFTRVMIDAAKSDKPVCMSNSPCDIQQLSIS